jgi:hypothetical protein
VIASLRKRVVTSRLVFDVQGGSNVMVSLERLGNA